MHEINPEANEMSFLYDEANGYGWQSTARTLRVKNHLSYLWKASIRIFRVGFLLVTESR